MTFAKSRNAVLFSVARLTEIRPICQRTMNVGKMVMLILVDITTVESRVIALYFSFRFKDYCRGQNYITSFYCCFFLLPFFSQETLPFFEVEILTSKVELQQAQGTKSKLICISAAIIIYFSLFETYGGTWVEDVTFHYFH